MEAELRNASRLHQWDTVHKQQKTTKQSWKQRQKTPNFKERNRLSQSSHLGFTEIGMHRTCYTQEVRCILASSDRQCDEPGSATEMGFGSNLQLISVS